MSGASGPQGGKAFSGLGLKERLDYIYARPSHFRPFWVWHSILIMEVGQQMLERPPVGVVLLQRRAKNTCLQKLKHIRRFFHIAAFASVEE